MNLKNYIKDIPDFPEKGILFRDITPLLQSPEALQYTCDVLADYAKDKGADVIVVQNLEVLFWNTCCL